MPAENALTYDTWSVISLWTAIAVYALAFICYSMDLAKRSDSSIKQRDRELVVAGGGSVSAPVASSDEPIAHANNMMARIATTLTWIAFLLHLAAVVLRGIGAGRVPWSNMYEFAMTSTMLFTGVYLFVLFWKDLRYVGAFMTGLVTVLLGAASMPNIYVQITPLADPLKSTWLIIHVFVASLATAFMALAFALSVLQLLQTRRERLVREDPSRDEKKNLLRTIPNAENLESLAYRVTIIGFILWTFTLIAGAIWAQDAWGRYWGFDTKEVWTFIVWVLYAGYIHARATRGWRGTRSAWLAIVGFAAVLFNFTIVNMFFDGLHSYAGLPD
ncbi:c-type cytochrome biogenesis protein CcsB [Microbacterium sorbitolivorans]|uniref:C-type cytochrome biogenesis protein CcsB n=1 Tax=Microbacterium sorbitolivorans TaxID=1867410 RepID=A0A367XY66_9MICO|nr:c-type cytochrome biogenesis protein CcsB [Microbacterium sorbitolivorans]RCK58548.1 c-type cytochrome biogenesis protein CcsB [Microbacterium sorbitolivorans]GGF37429.1 c-type cytochrome biogenesis protein CcsB [Microbacterium sorbitolivorans]